MKWNWGTGIFIVIVLFVGASVAFLIYAQQETWSMVEEDYYPKELRHEEKLVKMRNANALSAPMQISHDKTNLILQFPVDFAGMTITGKIDVYRPSDETLDVISEITVDSSLVQLIPLSKLTKGRYVVKVDWSSAGKNYFKEQDIFIP